MMNQQFQQNSNYPQGLMGMGSERRQIDGVWYTSTDGGETYRRDSLASQQLDQSQLRQMSYPEAKAHGFVE